MTTASAQALTATDPAAGRVNIAQRLSEMANRLPHKAAVICCKRRGAGFDYDTHTFSALERQVHRYCHGLKQAGIDRETRVILFVKPGFEFFALVFALFRIGAVPVMIDPGIGRMQIHRCLARIEAEAFIGVPIAHVLRLMHRGSFGSIKTCVTVGRRWFWGGLRLADIDLDDETSFPIAPTRAGDMAAILFTSGSTGPAKGVVYTHGTFDAQVDYLNDHFGYDEDEIDVATFPLFALFDAALGMTSILPAMDFTRPGDVDPCAIIEPILAHGATHMFGSPALLDRVSQYGVQNGVRLPSIKRILTAGAPVQPDILARVHQMLGVDAEVHTPYGATEALPVASIASREILEETGQRVARGAGVCVGPPIDGVDVRVIKITDDPIEQIDDAEILALGEIGEIIVRGPAVTPRYYQLSDATRLAKIPDGDTFWHRMGDVGYFDQKGRLWFCGRKAHRVRTDQGDLYTVCCEGIFNQHPAVRRTALVGVGSPGSQTPVLCVEINRGSASVDQNVLTDELLEMGAKNSITQSVRTILFHPQFPVDVRHNAKIFREKLAVWAAEKHGVRR